MQRSLAREQAFLILFEQIFTGYDTDDTIRNAKLCRDFEGDEFCRRLACGVAENREALDNLIGQYSHKWKINRIAKTALTALRIGFYEITVMEEAPVGVSINEAVELAKKYGGEEDAAFVNGVLGGYVKSAN